MMDITLADMFLLGWSVVATVYAFRYKEEKDKGEFAMQRILDDDELRENVVADYKRWRSEKIKAKFGGNA